MNKKINKIMGIFAVAILGCSVLVGCDNDNGSTNNNSSSDSFPTYSKSDLSENYNDFRYILNEDEHSLGIIDYVSMNKVVDIPECALYDNKVLPVTKIYPYAFSQNNFIEELNTSKNLKVIEQSAIMYCENLKKININYQLDIIKSSAMDVVENVKLNFKIGPKVVEPQNASCNEFFYNSETREYIIPEGVEYFSHIAYIEEDVNAFYIPSTIKELGHSLLNPNSLKKIYYNGTINDLLKVKFDGYLCHYMNAPIEERKIDIYIKNNKNNYEILRDIIVADNINSVGMLLPICPTLFSSSIENIYFPNSIKYLNSNFLNGISNNLEKPINIYFNMNMNEFSKVRLSYFNFKNIFIKDNDGYTKLTTYKVNDGYEVVSSFSIIYSKDIKNIIIPSKVKNVQKQTFNDGLNIFCESTKDEIQFDKEQDMSKCNVYYKGQWEMVNGEPKPII